MSAFKEAAAAEPLLKAATAMLVPAEAEAEATLFKTEELFLINYPALLTPDLGCIYHEYS